MLRCAVLLLLLASAFGAEAVRITLRPNVQIAADHAILADVAELNGDFDVVKTLAGIVVQALPDLAVYELDDAKIRMALSRAVDPRNLVISGTCDLRRKAQIVSEDEIIAAAKEELLKEVSGDVEIGFLRGGGPIVVPADDEHETSIKAESLTNAESGEMPFRVRIQRGERELGRGMVVLSARTFRTVVVAARALKRGDVINAGDVRTQRIQVGPGNAGALTNAEEPMGWTLTNNISEGTPISRRVAERAPAVIGGKGITLVYATGNFSVTSSGTALSNGSIGDIINVRRENDNKSVQAKVVDDGTALLNFQ